MPKSTSSARFLGVICGCLAIILVVIYISLTNGTFDMSVGEVLRTLLGMDQTQEFKLVIFDFRLPRIVIAVLIGMGLGVAGTVVQGVTRNPLADPGILGINGGAGMAVVLFMLLFQVQATTAGWQSVMIMPLFGLIGGITAAAFILWFARSGGRLDPQQLILVGIAVGSGFGAITLYLSLKMNPQDYESAVVWLAGSIHNANWLYITAMLPWLILLIPYIWYKSNALDVMQLEEISVQGLGVNTDRLRTRLLLAGVGLVSACVAVSGSMGFVGLIAPHIARRLVGIRHRYVIPVSALIGMAMVVTGDLIGKSVFAPMELSAGIVISLIGVPYFIYLLFRQQRA